MRGLFLAMLLLLADGAVPAGHCAGSRTEGDTKKEPLRSVSPVRPEQVSERQQQILVSGGEPAQRVRLLQLADALRQTTLQTLGQPLERFPVARPVWCVLQPKFLPGTPPRMELVEDPAGLKLVLHLAPLPVSTASVSGEGGSPGNWQLLPAVVPAPVRVERALIGAFLAELGLRPGPGRPAANALPRVPRWLVDVIYHKHHHPNPLFAPIQLRELLDSGDIPLPLPLLARPEDEPIPSSATEVDLARCMSSLLFNRTDGPGGLLQLLRVDLSEAPLEKLARAFPSLGRSEADFLREWTLQVAASGTEGERIALDGPQTDAEIRNLLQLDFLDPATGAHQAYPLEQFSDFLRLPGCRKILQTREIEWITLRGRAHFLYHAVLDAYAKVCAQLAAGRTAGVAQQLAQITLEREHVGAMLQRIRDHLNWFEAVEAPRTPSPRIQEIYRILEPPMRKPVVSQAVRDALDRAEAELRQREERMRHTEEREDIKRALDETFGRPRPAPAQAAQPR